MDLNSQKEIGINVFMRAPLEKKYKILLQYDKDIILPQITSPGAENYANETFRTNKNFTASRLPAGVSFSFKTGLTAEALYFALRQSENCSKEEFHQKYRIIDSQLPDETFLLKVLILSHPKHAISEFYVQKAKFALELNDDKIANLYDSNKFEYSAQIPMNNLTFKEKDLIERFNAVAAVFVIFNTNLAEVLSRLHNMKKGLTQSQLESIQQINFFKNIDRIKNNLCKVIKNLKTLNDSDSIIKEVNNSLLLLCEDESSDSVLGEVIRGICGLEIEFS